jgi:hypothetical protein
MTFREWSKAEVEYGFKLLNSGVAGVMTGQREFLDGKPLDPFLHDSARHAWWPAAIGACLGVMASSPQNGRRSSSARVLGFGLLGGLIGFTAGIAWETRRLTATAASAALDNVNKVRNEHWFEKHPIDYA